MARRITTFEVVLRIGVDLDQHENPADWNWNDVLDTSDEVEILSSSDLGTDEVDD